MLNPFSFTYRNTVIHAAHDPETGDIWISASTVETVLGYDPDAVLKRIGAGSLKAFAGADLVIEGTETYYSRELFFKVVYGDISNTSEFADVVIHELMADFDEATQAALGVQKFEQKDIDFEAFVEDFEAFLERESRFSRFMSAIPLMFQS